MYLFRSSDINNIYFIVLILACHNQKLTKKWMVKQFLFEVSAAALNALNQLLVWCRVSRNETNILQI